jgi:hypothetical protein
VRVDGTLEDNGARFVGTLVFKNTYLPNERSVARLDKVIE